MRRVVFLILVLAVSLSSELWAKTKVSLSSPDAAFRSFCKIWKKLKLHQAPITSVNFSVGAKTFRTIGHKKVTVEGRGLTNLSQISTGGLKFRPRKFRKRRKEQKGDRAEFIVAVQGTELVSSWRGGKWKSSRKLMKLVFEKEGREWRLAGWMIICHECRGQGICTSCRGTGGRVTKKVCEHCQSTKKLACYQCKGEEKQRKTCQACKGTGEKKCIFCEGRGYTLEGTCHECGRWDVGKCTRCNGKRWRDFFQEQLKSLVVPVPEIKTLEKFDLSTPEKTWEAFCQLYEAELMKQLVPVRSYQKRLAQFLELLAGEKLRKTLKRHLESERRIRVEGKLKKTEKYRKIVRLQGELKFSFEVYHPVEKKALERLSTSESVQLFLRKKKGQWKILKIGQ